MPDPTQEPAPTGQAENQPLVTQTTPQTETPPSTPEPLTPEAISALQQQAAEAQALRDQLAQTQQNYDHLRTDYTRKAQALAQLAGAQQQQPQADPLEPFVQKLVSKGYDKDNARDLVGIFHEFVQPIQQGFAQQQAALMSSNTVGDVLRQAYGKVPQAFADPTVAQSVEQVLRAEALKGNQVDVEYALDLAFVAQGRKQLSGQQQQAFTPPPQQTAQQNIGSMWNVPQGFPQRTMTPAPKQDTPLQQEVQSEIAQRFGIKK